MQDKYSPEVPEVDVLIGIAKWLYNEGWQLDTLSPVHTNDRRKIEVELTAAGISTDKIAFRQSGEDIRAEQGRYLWLIECKGLTSGTKNTAKTQFDRAVASCVSYYTKTEGIRLGLALPECQDYIRYLRTKLPQALRRALNMTVFIYCGKGEVWEFEPDKQTPD